MFGRGSGAAFSLSVFSCVVIGLFLTACERSDSSAGASNKISIQNTGSDTMVQIAQAWAEEYDKVKPSVSVEVAGGGSSVGIKDLVQGTVDIANCSRAMKPSEREQAIQNTKKTPIEFIVGYDGIGVYTHKDNPLKNITISQLAEIYKEDGTISKWSELGAEASFCPRDEIIRFSRQSNSGTYAFFRKAVLEKGDFKLGSRDMHGSKVVVDAVANTPCSVGYSGMGYKTHEVNFLAVKNTDDGEAFMPNAENVVNKNYPLARPLFVYTLGEPTGEVKAYLDWILSPDGQNILKDLGYVPVK